MLHLCARVGEVLEGFPARVVLGWDWRQVVVGESETKVIWSLCSESSQEG